MESYPKIEVQTLNRECSRVLTPFHFFTVIWGERYLKQYLEVTLPCFCAPGNFGAFRRHENDLYVVYTSRQGAASIQASPNWKLIEQNLRAEIIVVDDVLANCEELAPAPDAWKVVNYLYNISMRRSIQEGAAICLLQPDGIWSDGSFLKLAQIIDSGKKVVLTASVHTSPEKITPQILAKYLNRENSSISLSGRELVSLILTNMHEYTLVHNWDGGRFLNSAPGFIWWPVGEEGFISRNFCGAPQVIKFPANAPTWPAASGFELMDHIAQIIPNKEDYYLVQESDDVVIAGLEWAAPGNPNFLINPNDLSDKASILRVAHWVHKAISKNFRETALSSVFWHTHGRCSSAWKSAEQRADSIMRAIFDAVELFDEHPEVAKELDEELQIYRSLKMQIESGRAKSETRELKVHNIPEQNVAEIIAMIRSGDVDRATTILSEKILSDPPGSDSLIREVVSTLRLEGKEAEAATVTDKCWVTYNRALASRV